jgi:hypothetical protein
MHVLLDLQKPLQLRLEVRLEMCSWKLEAGCSVLDYTFLTESQHFVGLTIPH